jgi:hypothetical protein
MVEVEEVVEGEVVMVAAVVEEKEVKSAESSLYMNYKKFE